MSFDTYTRFFLALVAVLALMLAFAWLLRRYGLGARYVTRGGRRLAIVEVAAVDAKRRLVLLRRDDTEHLVLLGAQSELLIESGIKLPVTPVKLPATPENFASALRETQP